MKQDYKIMILCYILPCIFIGILGLSIYINYMYTPAYLCESIGAKVTDKFDWRVTKVECNNVVYNVSRICDLDKWGYKIDNCNLVLVR